MGSIYRTARAICPLCGHRLYWSCRGKTGWAHCSKSIHASREWSDRSFCEWKGVTIRDSQGTVYFIIENK